MIGIVSYGLGNVSAIANIYKRLGMPACLAGTPEELRASDRLILPGVGAFDVMSCLNGSGMRGALEDAVLRDRKPVLGICVGMQMLAERSDEGLEPGLGWVPGEVRGSTCPGRDRTHLPHMGWNDVACAADCGLFQGLGATRVSTSCIRTTSRRPATRTSSRARTTADRSHPEWARATSGRAVPSREEPRLGRDVAQELRRTLTRCCVTAHSLPAGARRRPREDRPVRRSEVRR